MNSVKIISTAIIDTDIARLIKFTDEMFETTSLKTYEAKY
jgi:hypothetical protein